MAGEVNERSILGLDLTFPLDFVLEWVKLKAIHRWTAKMQEGGAHSESEIAFAAKMETEGLTTIGKKTYVSLKINGVRFTCKEGRWQIVVVDVNSATENFSPTFQFGGSTSKSINTREKVHAVVESDSSNIAASVTSVGEENGCMILKTTKDTDRPAAAPSEDGEPFAPAPVTDGSAGASSAVKRKRGRPRKSSSLAAKSTPELGPSSTTCGSDKPARYSLRGKKLPASIFGDSDSEEEDFGDSDYQPSSQKLARPKTVGDKDSRGDKEFDGDRSVSGGNTDQAERPQESSATGVSSQNAANSLVQDSQGYSANKATSLSPVSTKKKRLGQAAVQKDGLLKKNEQPVRKKRLKIDVTGLPSFARRKRNRERKAACRLCKRRFCDFTGVMMHVKKFHMDVGNVQEYLEELRRLAVTKCSLCGQEFDNRFQLQLHEDKVHYKAGSLPCRHCGKTFASMVLVKQHIRSVHQTEGQAHACPICPARFKWSTTMRAHVSEVHQGVRAVQCADCGKRFHRTSQLNRHRVIHGPDTAKLACGDCGRRFWYSSNLQRHLAIVHGSREEAFHCPYCGRGFRRKEGLNGHVEKVHFSLFPHHCPVCRAGFTRALLLQKHMASQHSVDNFVPPPARPPHFKYNRDDLDLEALACGLCDAAFCYKAQLVQHVLGCHGDVFPYHCDRCQQMFVEPAFLALHRQRAHGIPPPEEGQGQGDVEGQGEATEPQVDGLSLVLGSESIKAKVLPVPPSSSRVSSDRVTSRGVSLLQPLPDVFSDKDTARTISVSNSSLAAFDKKGPAAGVSVLRLKSEREEVAQALAPTPTSSYIIKVENGNSSIQYVIHNPEGDLSAPSDAVMHNIASVLLAAEHSLDGNTPQNIVIEQGVEGNAPQNIVIEQGIDGIAPQNIVTDQGLEGNRQQNIVLDQGIEGNVQENIIIDQDLDDNAPQNIIIEQEFEGNVPQNIVIDQGLAHDSAPQNIVVEQGLESSVPQDIVIDQGFDGNTPQSIVLHQGNISSDVVQYENFIIEPEDDQVFEESGDSLPVILGEESSAPLQSLLLPQHIVIQCDKTTAVQDLSPQPSEVVITPTPEIAQNDPSDLHL